MSILLNRCKLSLPSLSGKEVYHYDTRDQGVSIISSVPLEKIKQKGISTTAIRIHSSCMHSEQFGSRDCDCAEQLKSAVWYISNIEDGIIIYLSQEGRGHGNSTKIKIMATMQAHNMDTVEACEHLNIPVDVRNFDKAINILKDWNIESVRLISNNNKKEAALINAGITVQKKIRLPTESRKENIDYLLSKRSKLNHNIAINKDSALSSAGEAIRFYHPDEEMGFLSNLSKYPINVCGSTWCSVEHFYKAHKHLSPQINDDIELSNLHEMAMKEPVHPDWELIKYAVMYTAIYTKFTQHPELKNKLLETGCTQLIENSKKDYLWGIGDDQNGKNYMGKLLMVLRDDLLTH